MPFKKKRVADVGVVEASGDKYRVHMQYRDEAGAKKYICGPWRNAKQRAEEDLMAMRAAGMAEENVERQKDAFDSMAQVAIELQAKAAEERSTIPWAQRETPTEAFLRASERELNVQDLVYVPPAQPPIKTGVGSVDADEPWQIDSDEESDVIGASHDKPTFGLDRLTKQRLSRFKGFSAHTLLECKKLVHSFVGKRASAAQVRQLLAMMPPGCGDKVGINTQDLETSQVELTDYTLLVDYRRRIFDFLSCVKAPPGKKRVVLKVIEMVWAQEVAAGNKHFECVANKHAWLNRFKGLRSGDLFVVVTKGDLQVAAVCEVAASPSTKVEDVEVLHLMLPPALHTDLAAYLEESSSFDFVMFRMVWRPPQPMGVRNLIPRIGAEMPRQWQGVVNVAGEDVHARLGALIESWPSHVM